MNATTLTDVTPKNQTGPNPATCTCTRPGFCPRFGREMAARDYNTCRRRDALGAEARATWEAMRGAVPPPVLVDGATNMADIPPNRPSLTLPARTSRQAGTVPPVPLLLVKDSGTATCPGDILALTATLESLHIQYPGRYLTDVRTTCAPLFEHNPRVTRLEMEKTPGLVKVEMHYDQHQGETIGVNRSNEQARHFLEGFVTYLGRTLGIPLELQVNRPALYLSEDEKRWTSQVQEVTGKPTKFWLVNAGYKDCYTTKGWAAENYQAVVNACYGRIQFVQIGEDCREHHHPRLERVINLVGKTSLRQLVRLAWHAQGGLGPSTFLQHVMAAWQKPYVCVHRAAEPLTWISYPKQIVISRLGSLPCCADKACWKSRTVPLGDGKDKTVCERPIFGASIPQPKCLALIRPEEVMRAVESYYEGGVLTY